MKLTKRYAKHVEKAIIRTEIAQSFLDNEKYDRLDIFEEYRPSDGEEQDYFDYQNYDSRYDYYEGDYK